ncbi:MAG: choice-of-anchor U domain-containing protein [Acidovorax sp.]|nr:choice-of-anchor U domain-containing protein [Acidovorax sp.]
MKLIERAARTHTPAIKRLQAQIPQYFLPASVSLIAALWHAHAAAAVGWNVTAPMATPRAQHAGALMDDGSVGVFGGVNRDGFVVGSERYFGGAWNSLGNPGIQGNVFEAVTLGTGHVLVRTDGSLNARLYDPVANTWSTGGAQAVTRSLPSVTLLDSGKVLVAGGSSHNSAELYDPLTRTWTATGSMSVVRRAHGAVLLRDGRVLVASGFNSSGEVPEAEIYDPVTGTWTLAASPLVPRHYASLTLLPDGRALLAGGFTGGGVTTHAEIYDPVANTWTATGAMQFPRNGAMGSPLAHATVLASGQVLIGGGSDGARNAQPLAELYDAALGTWSPAGSMAVGRENGTANLLPDGDVLMAGGYSSNPSLTFYASVEFYTLAVPAGPVPVVDALPLLQRAGTALAFTGTGFTGATGTSTPQLQLQRAENGAISTFAPASHTDTSFTSGAVGTLPAGLYMARVLVDGVPSAARLVRFTDSAGTPSGTAGNGQVAVSWAPPANDRGNPPVGYTVTSSPASAGCTATAPASSCTVTGLTNGTAYTFTVQAAHPNGPGPLSLASTAVTPVANQYTGPSPGGAGTISVVVTGGGPACTLVGADTSAIAPPAGAPAQLVFPYGVFQFRASGCVPGSTLQVAITYPNPLAANVQFWKYGPAVPAAASTWFAYPGTTLSPDRRTVTYSITDNGIGDSDSANGVVLDPLGAALAPLGAGVTSVPGLSPAGVALATLLIAMAMGWSGRAKRAKS